MRSRLMLLANIVDKKQPDRVIKTGSRQGRQAAPTDDEQKGGTAYWNHVRFP